MLGEHSVVYGAPALGFPLERSIDVRIGPGSGHINLSSADDVDIPAPGDAASPREIVEHAMGSWMPKKDIAIHFGFPPMSGFGSSAALALALQRGRAALETRQPAAGEEMMRKLLSVERVAHAKPSGVDPAICLADGLIQFRRENGKGKPEVNSLVPAKPLHFLIGTIGAHGGARRTVSRVAEMKKQSPPMVKAAMAALGEAASTGARAVKKGDLDGLGSAMDLAHGVLSGFGLVSADVDRAVQKARLAGALGAKMSGAGGEGGAFLALFASRKAAEAAKAELGLTSILCWTQRVESRVRAGKTES